MKILKELGIILLLFGVLWGSFTFLDFKSEPIEASFSVENEAFLADLMMDNFLDDNKVLSNNTLDSAMYILKNRLESALGETNYDYKIYVVENENINAFATLDGNIVIFSGIIKFLDSPEQLCSVLAHEMGHVEERHVINKILKELGIALLMGVVTGGDPAIVSEILRSTVSTVFDRKQETSADNFGLKLLEKAKINPAIMGTTFRMMKNKLDTPYSEQTEFLMTHPNMNKRIKMALNYKTKKTFEAQKLDVNWKKLQKSL